ncbi:substrate-binding domain-containing protein [Kibdelosporangium philippinense]|uniref:Substrate-binding domain-containing protein n=1 Tax=Kibdelosporangium philippinense TaxID=211113 RepID=A0ABS8Z343_9PSEU|nr:substrate-binding domain-containing protein [Kibdelosporangium philippinense]MCE7002348.1 substrate-binding domain-containing protein [Kibdelosporangium philippinense]
MSARRCGTTTALALLVGAVLAGTAACAPGATSGPPTSTAPIAGLDQAAYARQDAERKGTFSGDPAKPYLQFLPGETVRGAGFALNRPGKVCFSNASLSNVWRQTGWLTMYQQFVALRDAGRLAALEVRDAQDSENTQVADIDYLIKEGNCDGYIVAPATVDATKDAIERACATGKPVIVFDRGTTATCVTSFVHSIGGYAWGIDASTFIASKLRSGQRVVALRTASGVDVFEQRWAAAQKIFRDAGITVTDHITGADPAKIKNAMADELAKGKIDAVWTDLGDQAVPAVEAFQDAGQPIPPINGEDNMAYLRAWKKHGFEGFAAVYSCFQWRTALLGLDSLLHGTDIPKDWVLPQVPITAETRDQVLAANTAMPDVHSARFGGEDLPGFPQVWIERKMP